MTGAVTTLRLARTATDPACSEDNAIGHRAETAGGRKHEKGLEG